MRVAVERAAGLPEQIEFSVVVPVHNEAGNAADLAREIARVFEGRSYEMIFVDDASRDGTRGELAAEKKAAEEKMAEARAQQRSELSDRDARLKDVTQQLDQARADVFAAKNEAESFR